MATETSKDELLQLVKRFSAYLTVKMSNLFSFSTLDSRSVGAVAGLAVAVVFTWRLLRSNSGPQRRQPKRQAPTTSSSVVTTQPNAVSIPSGDVCSSLEDLRVQNVVDEFFQTAKPSLGQIVRQKLSEGRKVLFCSSETGRSSFVRQLEPDWHIDTNPEIIFQLARFIKYQLHISPIRPERAAANVLSSPSLEQFFGST